MNKRIITTSLALMMAMTVVLAVGKTENTIEQDSSQLARTVETKPGLELNASNEVPEIAIDASVREVNALIITSGANESELILEAEPAQEHPREPSLMNTLVRLQQALDKLEQVASNTELAVIEFENQFATR